MGHGEVLRPGEIQVMSAGTGIIHSEFNNLPDREVKFLQIWIFPDRDDLTPRYKQIRLAKAEPDRLRPWTRRTERRRPASTWGGFTRRHGSRRST
ncbi:MAG: pirin family protein [Alistipes shahii]